MSGPGLGPGNSAGRTSDKNSAARGGYIVSFNGGATSKGTAKGAEPELRPIGARRAESFGQTGLHFRGVISLLSSPQRPWRVKLDVSGHALHFPLQTHIELFFDSVARLSV